MLKITFFKMEFVGFKIRCKFLFEEVGSIHNIIGRNIFKK